MIKCGSRRQYRINSCKTTKIKIKKIIKYIGK